MPPIIDDQPLRAELFSVGQLERHARTIAGWHELTPRASHGGDWLLERLASNAAALDEACALVTDAVSRGRQITPAAEWLIDNFHVIEDQIALAKKHLPRSYNRELPRLVNGAQPNTPRVYHIAIELISHAHGRVDDDGLRAFVAAYQETRPLQLGELWAIPIMLRLALIENLRRVATRVMAGRRERERAALWVAKMVDAAAVDPQRVVLVLAELIEENVTLTHSFASEFASRLQVPGALTSYPMSWLEQRLAAKGETVEHVFELASQSQAADQVSVGNSIGSLRLLSASDWRVFVESMSRVEVALKADPMGAYGAMDFATRDTYRHAVERLSRRSKHSEEAVARAAVLLASQVKDGRASHVGFYLVDTGLAELERALHVRRGLGERLFPRSGASRLIGYGGAVVLSTVLVALLGSYCSRDAAPWVVLLAFCASQFCVALVNLATTLVVKPTLLARLDFSKGIPREHRTLVAVPTLLTDTAEIDALVEALEIRFLANRDASLCFALLTDFRDAATERMEGDEALLAHATKTIEALNSKYPPSEGEGFHLLHRARRWNSQQGVWMGWERKRGKLEDLNACLRGDCTRFAATVGPPLVDVRYVIVLDSDTQLPRDAARLLAATLAHPLNRPVYNEVLGRVTAGYGILQPRVASTMESINRSRFARLFGGETGVDPYTRAVSDIYQDVFAEGSFVGKGIYDVDAFQCALQARFPDDRVLSHDLLEGAYARSALVSDVLLVEEYPAMHASDASRRSRWMRGDWQIVSWLRRRVPAQTDALRRPLSWLSQWKVVDNLRRSLVPMALLGLLFWGWVSGFALFVSVAVAASFVLPGLVNAATALWRRPKDSPRGSHWREVAWSFAAQLGRDAFCIACLPADAWLSLDAIARTLFRLLVSHKLMLQWRTASDAMRGAQQGLLGALGSLWMGPVSACAALVLLPVQVLAFAAPWLILWFLSPLFSWWLSRPLVPKRAVLPPADVLFLESLARRTWSFFETYVTASENWLPPDNFQLDPPRGIAHRTSPTNIGLSLLANLAAYDFGFIDAATLSERTKSTLDTLDRMERYRGHFYNWYDTLTLEVLKPMYVSTVDSGNLVGHLLTLAAGLDALDLRPLATRCRALCEVDYGLVYDRTRHLMAIGYNVSEHRLDPGYYDLLASEVRLISFVAIAQSQIPQEHWFSLGRQLTTTAGRPALLSWSGSMFEYLMPLLVMPTYEGTLLDETYRAVVERQIKYGRERSVPWGISESGYNKTDAQLNYQYRAFGAPGLGFKRGLAEDLVIAPYASVMALMVAPVAACANLKRLAQEGFLGAEGFYEAIDYTPSRVPAGERSVTVASYMAHHQGMSLLALAYLLRDRPMQRRFTSTPAFRATELLLQERVPRSVAVFPHPAEVSKAPDQGIEVEHELRVFQTPSTPTPQVHLLSNGRYHLAITNAGGGYSRWRDLAVTRWHEDTTCDASGSFGYLRDVGSGAYWSLAHQPTLIPGASYEAIFTKGRAEFRRVDRDIECHVEIAISPEDDIELRRVSLTNRGRSVRTIELTTYAEVVLCQPAADAAHPAFSNLFVQTELVPEQHAILCTRRPRSGSEQPPWMLHMLTVHGAAQGETSYETSRPNFIGRARSVVDPISLQRETLTNTVGSVLDPIVAIRTRVVLRPDESVRLHVVTGVAETKEGALALVEKYRDRHAAERVMELSWTHSHVVQRRLDASNLDIRMYEKLASSVLYANAALRADGALIARNRGSQSGLWAYSISGDLPIVLVRIADVANLPMLRHMIKAHAYWRLKGLIADLVVWNEDPSGYRQVLQDEIMAVINSISDANLLDRSGGIFVRRSEQISEQDKVLIQTVARVIIRDSAGTLIEQIERPPRRVDVLPPKLDVDLGWRSFAATPAPAPQTLVAANGLGGFSEDGREYVITTGPGKRTPAPWVNVLANPWFGTVISESGSAYTWCENAHSYRLTPWHNDAVTDASGEMFYLRDEEDGHFWSPTPMPVPTDASYTTRHGFGYSTFSTVDTGITSELSTFVAVDAPLKFVVIKLRNHSGIARKVSVTTTFELVLGSHRAMHAPYIVSELDSKTSALFARNAYNGEFGARVAFLDCSEPVRTTTCDRLEVIGRNGTAQNPACLLRQRLSGRSGAALDPCLTMQVSIELAEGEERDVSFIFGSGRDLADARTLVTRFRGTEPAQVAFEAVTAFWAKTLSAVTVKTPDRTLDFLANGWLLYQTLACRMWARSGFYQSGGAFGFRDQLQDAMALLHAQPAVLREQIVRSASRQFLEGDVQHWWHPPLGRGVRTHISDDYLWLPYAVCRYVSALADDSVLDAPAAFLEGRAVKPEEDSYYDLPVRSDEVASVYEHCRRAIVHGMRFGERGLPLMGSGDWNDGMNLVGEHGKGESVWLAFFLYDVLIKFAPIAQRRNDDPFAVRCREVAAELRANIEKHAWDGAWYRRAYFDDGAPLGSQWSPECKIDSLPQSWAVLSGAGDPGRAQLGLDALDAHLVNEQLGVVKLFEPPFDTSNLRPGYIKGYVPGVRENGGQYTHGAVWAAMAFAEGGRVERAWAIFDLINPVHHGDSAEGIATYKIEPYVVAADVYTNPQHAGRGGWSWYTGSAGWMYQLITESLLGIHREGDRLRIAPRLRASWSEFTIAYRYGETVYHIRIVAKVGADASASVLLVDDGAPHEVLVAVSTASAPDRPL